MHNIFDQFNKTKNTSGKYVRPNYSLRNVHSDKVLDIAQDGPNAGSAILWEGWAGDNQTFAIVENAGEYSFRCKKNGQFLTVAGPENGAKLFLSPANGQANQKFKITEAKPGSKDHVIYTCYGKAIDVLEWKKDNGAKIAQYNFTGEKNQLWNFCDPKDITSSSSHND